MLCHLCNWSGAQYTKNLSGRRRQGHRLCIPASGRIALFPPVAKVHSRNEWDANCGGGGPAACCTLKGPYITTMCHYSALVLQYCSRDERDATAAEVGAGGLLRYVGTGEPVHTLSTEDSDMLVSGFPTVCNRALQMGHHQASLVPFGWLVRSAARAPVRPNCLSTW